MNLFHQILFHNPCQTPFPIIKIPLLIIYRVEDDDEIDLGELLATLVDNKWLIVFITMVVTIIGTGKALIDKPVYKTDAMLQVVEKSKSSSIEALDAVSGLLESKVPALAEIEIITSRMILGAAVKNLDMEIIAKPKYFPVIGEAIARRFQRHNEGDEVSSPLFGKTQYAWGGESIHVDTFTVPPNLLGKPFILIAGKQGHFQLLLEDELILEGEVGKLASKQMEDKQQPVTLFVSLLKARPDTQFILLRQSESNAISQLKDTITAAEKGKKTGILELTLESTSADAAVRTLNEVANIYVRQNVEQKSEEAQKTLVFLEKQLPMLKEQLKPQPPP